MRHFFNRGPILVVTLFQRHSSDRHSKRSVGWILRYFNAKSTAKYGYYCAGSSSQKSPKTPARIVSSHLLPFCSKSSTCSLLMGLDLNSKARLLQPTSGWQSKLPLIFLFDHWVPWRCHSTSEVSCGASICRRPDLISFSNMLPLFNYTKLPLLW